MEIIPHIHMLERTKIGNVFLVVKDDTLTLIDTGAHGNLENVLNLIRGTGHAPAELDTILITHAHWDHVGSLRDVQEHTGATTLVPPREQGYITGAQKPLTPRKRGLDGLFFTMMAPFTGYEPCSADGVLTQETAPPGFTVIETPGHTEGALSLYMPDERVLFVGDVLMNGAKGLSLPFEAATDDMALNKKSLGALLSLNVDVLCFGHGAPVIGAADEKLMSFMRGI